MVATIQTERSSSLKRPSVASLTALARDGLCGPPPVSVFSAETGRKDPSQAIDSKLSLPNKLACDEHGTGLQTHEP
jgi:hypothetical protein